jgi:hypothetical protein
VQHRPAHGEYCAAQIIIHEQNTAELLTAVTECRRLLSQPVNPPIQEVIELVAHACHCMSSLSSMLIFAGYLQRRHHPGDGLDHHDL